MLFPDADTGIGDVNPRIELPRADRHRNAAAFRGVFYPVVQDIAQSLRRPLRVMLHRNRRRAVRGQLDIFSVRFRPYGTDRLGDGLLKGRFFHVQDKCPRLQPGHFDQRLHQKFQFIDLRGHGLQKLRPLFLGQLMLPKDAGKHLKIGNRGFHLMGNIADQLLNGLLIPLALHFALVHDVIVLQKLSLYPGRYAVLIRPLQLRLSPGNQGIQRITYFVCKVKDLSLPKPGPQTG